MQIFFVALSKMFYLMKICLMCLFPKLVMSGSIDRTVFLTWILYPLDIYRGVRAVPYSSRLQIRTVVDDLIKNMFALINQRCL